MCMAVLACTPSLVEAQAESRTPNGERIGIGAALTPAIEGVDPWFAAGYRLNVPIGARAGIDVESSVVSGGRSPYGSITSFLALNVRIARGERAADGTGRYWIAGLRYLPISRSGRVGDADLGLTLGHGWDQTLRRGRIAAEVGLSGGESVMIFGTLIFSLSFWQ